MPQRFRSSENLTTNSFGLSTAGGSLSETETIRPAGWCLTILYHTQLDRIGGQYWWRADQQQPVALSRLRPLFAPQLPPANPAGTVPATGQGGGMPLNPPRQSPASAGESGSPSSPWPEPQALDDPQISRSLLFIEPYGTGLCLRPESTRVVFSVEGRPGGAEEPLPLMQLTHGVLLTLGQQVVLSLRALPRLPGAESYGLLGVSNGIEQVRHELGRLARLNLPVLITGESGSGKELVARAIHHASPRASRRMVTVNMSAVPASTAAAQLFGYARGAFTGATEARPGLMAEASGGTLFLDEIGETPSELQPMLLRAIELREIQPLGLPPQSVDVRFIAATDANLERLVERGQFRAALLFRLSSSVLHIPSLRERREDIPLLLLHFLREALTELQARDRLDSTTSEGPAWIRRQDMLALLRYHWPGNVRELKNVAWQLAIACHEQPVAILPAELVSRLTRPPGRSDDSNPTPSSAAVLESSAEPVRLADISPARVREVLKANDWQVSQAAEQLGISRSALYTWMDQLGIRHAGALTREEIAAALQPGVSGIQAVAERLQVSARALKLRMKQLGLTLPER